MAKSKKLLILLVVLLLLVSFALGALRNKSKHNPKDYPSFADNNYESIEIKETLAFSHSSGFYDKEFLLSINTDNKDIKIYYTLDGTEPTPNSVLYEEPIEIKNREKDKDIYTQIRYVADRYMPPFDPVFKATIVRCRAFEGNMPISEIVTGTYFVDSKGSNRYSLPVISLVSDPINLFDYNSGIYVKGKFYDELYSPALEEWELEGNFSQKGREWEKEACMEFFNMDGTLGFSQNVGIRIHGGATRTYPQKSLRIYARKEYGENSIDYPVFEGQKIWVKNNMTEKFKTLLLRNSGNDWYNTLFRDAIMQSLMEHTSLDLQAYQPSIVFINGEYWGIHNIRERIDKNYFESYYNIDENELVILEDNGILDEGIPGDEKLYLDMIDYIKENSLENSSNYEYINTLVDIDNLIDYYVAQIFFGNTDWPGNNNRFWRKRVGFNPNSAYGHDGRWRWVLFDTDFGFGLYPHEGDYNTNTLLHATKAGGSEWPNPDWSTFLLRNLLSNETFKNKFINRFADHLNTSFEPERVVERIADMKELIEPEIGEHTKRWFFREDWKKSIDVIIEFAQRRPEKQREHIMSFFNLQGRSSININVSDKNHGYVKINTIDVNENTPGIKGDVYPWAGIYFNGIPITITAIPAPGHKFVRWEGGSYGDSQTLNLILKGDMTIKAVFE
ncbi:MAG: hypothetical protein GX270_14490 [Clostridiaceae bacterium]|nr:hypothetical protein [Clostridiaceae bacterium]